MSPRLKVIATIALTIACFLSATAPSNAARKNRGGGTIKEEPNEPSRDETEAREGEVSAKQAKGGLRYRIMVSDFEDKSQYASYAGSTITQAWSEMLTDALQNDGRFLVVAGVEERITDRQEQEFSDSDWATKGKTSPKRGRMATAQLLVEGTIVSVLDNTGGATGGTRLPGIPIIGSRSGAEVRMIVKVYDAQSALVIASKEIAGKSSSWNLGLPKLPGSSSLFFSKNKNLAKAAGAALEEAVKFCADQLEKFEWTGAITSVKSDGSIIVNRGVREGVDVGQTFAVGACKAMDDPETGELLGYDKTQVATVRVTKTFEKYSICETIEKPSASIAQDMSIWIPETL